MGKFEKKFFMNEEILLEDAKKSILNLAEDNEIFFITSRISLKERTEEQIRTLLGDFDFNLHFSSNSYAKTSGKTKDEICAELGIDFMIEDDFGYATKCAEKGIKSFLIDKPWNQDCVYENIIRVKDWNEILENFNELKNGD